ncbi:MAG TPA: diacylglycerol kinase family protein [Candidatus Acidoferrales bacterium]|nr:diacylglycerol kinase family protein [Candidatus Acidoferrales bacterium]
MPDGIKDALLIYNPASGRRRHRRFVEVERASRILKEAGIATELAPTTARDTATGIARQAVEQRRGMVIVCGGDGTINEVVNGLAGSQVPMALLPAGTANILAKELGIPWDIPQAARLIPGGIVRRIAVGLAQLMNGHSSDAVPRHGRYFLCVAGAGPDGAIVNGIDENLKERTGILAYWAEGVRQFFRYRFPEMLIRSDSKERRATFVILGRTAHYGGPFKITTGASLFEDSFEVLTNSQRNRFCYLTCLPALWLGRLRNVKGIEAWKAIEAVCEAAGTEPVYAQVDGEPIGAAPVSFRIVPDALSLVIPVPRKT